MYQYLKNEILKVTIPSGTLIPSQNSFETSFYKNRDIVIQTRQRIRYVLASQGLEVKNDSSNFLKLSYTIQNFLFER